MRRHFGDTHAFGETSSITPHSPLSRRGVKSISVGFPVEPLAQKSYIFRHFQTLVGAGEGHYIFTHTPEGHNAYTKNRRSTSSKRVAFAILANGLIDILKNYCFIEFQMHVQVLMLLMLLLTL